MPVYRIPRAHLFPHPSEAEPDGLLGVGGDLDPRRLLLGYASGIFPWYSAGQPILWFSPDPRFVLEPDALTVPRSLAKVMRQRRFEIRLDTAFEQVIRGCKSSRRRRGAGTWITAEMLSAYIELHRLGFAHSAEAWLDGALVGGLYGVGLGRLFAGESMFTVAPDASKVAFVWLTRQLAAWGFSLIDSQVETDHLTRFGAHHLPRAEYLAMLPELTAAPTRGGPWSFDPDFLPLEIQASALHGSAPGASRTP